MSENDPPVAADDFPEFGEPPQQIPKHLREPEKQHEPAKSDSRQDDVDAVIARLRQERAEGKR